MADMIVNSEQSLSLAIGMLRESFKVKKYVTMRLKFGKARTVNMNSISHAWYQQVADELREDDARGVKRYCKLVYGVPILRAEDDDFREVYDSTIKASFTYEQKLAIMDVLEVTSLMSTKQFSQYLEDVQAHYLTRGVLLKFPEKN